jgi:hypothetical protein
MAQDITPKQKNFVGRYQNALQALRSAVDQVRLLNQEWSNMGFATGAPNVDGTSWIIPDAQVQAAIPQATAVQLNSAVGGATAVVTAFDSNAGYIEPLLP